MKRCSWCGHLLLFWQRQSAGRTMHSHCAVLVDRITGETERQYAFRQAQLRWEEEDRL